MTETHVLSSKSDVAYAELRRQILSGDLAPGSRLAQYELATSLNMSITPLREAIRRLSSEGLVDLDTHRNVRRRPHRRHRGPATLRGAAAPGPTGGRARRQHAAPPTTSPRWKPRCSGSYPSRAREARRRSPPTAASSRHLWRLAQRRPDPAPRRSVGQVRPLPPLRPGARARRRVADPRLRRTPAHGRPVVAGDGAKAALLMHLHITSSVTPAAIAVLDEREQVTGKSD